jgi:hypothetical protein
VQTFQSDIHNHAHIKFVPFDHAHSVAMCLLSPSVDPPCVISFRSVWHRVECSNWRCRIGSETRQTKTNIGQQHTNDEHIQGRTREEHRPKWENERDEQRAYDELNELKAHDSCEKFEAKSIQQVIAGRSAAA